MCCNNRTHVIVISIICLVITGLSALWFGFTTVATFIRGDVDKLNYFIDGENIGNVVGIIAVIHPLWITSQSLSIVGAVKNNRWFLLPFMICLILQTSSCGLSAYFIYLGMSDGCYMNFRMKFVCPWVTHILPLLIATGVSIYFFVITIKFYRELSSGRVDGEQPGIFFAALYNFPRRRR